VAELDEGQDSGSGLGVADVRDGDGDGAQCPCLSGHHALHRCPCPCLPCSVAPRLVTADPDRWATRNG
jgi:hypothetical protein